MAAGDITFYEDAIHDKQLHIEHWDNAVKQGKHAARVMVGEIQPFAHVPYFFSDVFDLSYEFWGDPSGAAQTVHRGEVEDSHFQRVVVGGRRPFARRHLSWIGRMKSAKWRPNGFMQAKN